MGSRFQTARVRLCLGGSCPRLVRLALFICNCFPSGPGSLLLQVNLQVQQPSHGFHHTSNSLHPTKGGIGKGDSSQEGDRKKKKAQVVEARGMSEKQHAPGAHQAGSRHSNGVSVLSALGRWRKEEEEVTLSVKET